MGKYIQTSMDDMDEALLEDGTYPLVIETCRVQLDEEGTPVRKKWGDCEDAGRVIWLFSVADGDDVPESAVGKTIREITADGKGVARQLKKYLKGLGKDEDSFVPHEAVGVEVWGSVGHGVAFDEPCNKVWEFTLRD